jgi:hypothetical protein
MWTFDPLPPPQVRDIEASRHPETGEVQARVTCTPWDARARLRYSDLTAGMDVFDTDPVTGARFVKAATLRLIATACTVTAAEGFPPVGAEPFDPTRIDHLLTLPAHVLAEVQDHATDVQPLPGSRRATAPVKGGDTDTPEPEDEDPTRKPSTRPAASSGTGSRQRTRTSTRKS